MPRQPSRASRARAPLTREQSLAVSARVCNRRGYRGPPLDDIARALDLTTAALYSHLPNKEEILVRGLRTCARSGAETS